MKLSSPLSPLKEEASGQLGREARAAKEVLNLNQAFPNKLRFDRLKDDSAAIACPNAEFSRFESRENPRGEMNEGKGGWRLWLLFGWLRRFGLLQRDQ